MKKASNLLLCTTNRHIRGGVETYLRAILPRLSQLWEHISLVYEQGDGDGPTIDNQAGLEQAWELTAASREAVWTAVQKCKFDVVFNNGMSDSEFENRLTRYPVVYFAHNYVGTCLAGYKRHAWPSPEPCFRTVGLGCVAYYFPRRCGGLSPLPLWTNYLTGRRQLSVLRACTRLVVASEAMRAEYLRHGFASDRVVLNPLFPTSYRPDSAPPAPRQRSGVVLLAGRLTQVKGGEYLVKALHQARRSWNGPALQLAVAGEGPESARLKSLAQELAVPARFHGWLDGADLEALMRQVDLLAMPSLWPEPFGLLGVEAGCFGVPSVGYAHGGIPDWLVEGESGALTPSPPTVEGLAQAIVRALRDPEHHHRLRLGAWEMAQRFNLEDHLRRLDNVFRSAAAFRPSAAPA